MPIEIYYADLSQELQEEILSAAGISSPYEANWEIFPITTIYIEPFEEEN